MPKFGITIEETVSQEFEVSSLNSLEALSIAMDKYRSGEFVIVNGTVLSKQIAITKPSEEATEWGQF